MRTKTTPTEREQAFAAHIADIAQRARIDSWESFVEALHIPADFAPAMITNRVELLQTVKPRAMDADEVAALITLIKGLIETNAALRDHAAELASMMLNLRQQFHGIRSVMERINCFAQFDHSGAAEPLGPGGLNP